MLVKILKSFFQPTYYKRVFFFILLDILLFFLSYLFSFGIRFGIGEVLQNFHIYEIFLFLFILVKIFLFFLFDIYSLNWKYFSLKDALKIIFILTFAQILLFLIFLLLFKNRIIYFLPRSVFFLDYFFSLWFILFLRIFKRVFLIIKSSFVINDKKSIIIYGAGDAGEKIIRSMISSKGRYSPVAIIDDDPVKKGTKIHGIKVFGGMEVLKKLKNEFNCDSILIAIPSIDKDGLKKIYDFAQKIGFREIKILPSIERIINGEIGQHNIKNVDITDLLGREKVEVNIGLITGYLKDQKILVTGAAGSIGSEMVHQLIRFQPGKIYALDINETELFYLKERIKRKFSKDIEIILSDIRDFESIQKIIDEKNITIVFHAAALKHVPMCEEFPFEAVKTNIFGTYNLLKSSKGKVKRFLYISTDKAVNPVSIMGASKRIGEILVNSQSDPYTKFFVVRFGNVLGSRGSVIPIFEEQLKNGGPITVTDENMTRYFMTISEAVILSIEAAGLGKGGETFMLDMGKPVKIKDIAENIIRMYGYQPNRDIKIVYTGIRKGEKLFEELFSQEDLVEKTEFDKIFKIKDSTKFSEKEIEKMLKDFNDEKRIVDTFKFYLKEFKHE